MSAYRHERLPAKAPTGKSAYRHERLPAKAPTGMSAYRQKRLPALKNYAVPVTGDQRALYQKSPPIPPVHERIELIF